MDFLDPFNMLSVWLSGGRHSWVNKDFDTKVKTAASFLGPTDQRIKMFQDAEKILVSDVPGVFIYHETPIQLIKPWVTGAALQPDKNGNKSLHWPGYTTADTRPQRPLHHQGRHEDAQGVDRPLPQPLPATAGEG